MNDFFVNFECVDGHCPLIVEEQKYGISTSTCDDYCGSGFLGCDNCYFEDSEECKECVHNDIAAG